MFRHLNIFLVSCSTVNILEIVTKVVPKVMSNFFFACKPGTADTIYMYYAVLKVKVK